MYLIKKTAVNSECVTHESYMKLISWVAVCSCLKWLKESFIDVKSSQNPSYMNTLAWMLIIASGGARALKLEGTISRRRREPSRGVRGHALSGKF